MSSGHCTFFSQLYAQVGSPYVDFFQVLIGKGLPRRGCSYSQGQEQGTIKVSGRTNTSKCISFQKKKIIFL